MINEIKKSYGFLRFYYVATIIFMVLDLIDFFSVNLNLEQLIGFLGVIWIILSVIAIIIFLKQRLNKVTLILPVVYLVGFVLVTLIIYIFGQEFFEMMKNGANAVDVSYQMPVWANYLDRAFGLVILILGAYLYGFKKDLLMEQGVMEKREN